MDRRFSFLLEDFGLSHIKPLAYPPGRQLKVEDRDYSGISVRERGSDQNNMTINQDGRPAISYLGTPVFSDLKLSYTGRIQGFIEVYLDWVLLEVNQTKHIVKTAIDGRNGTVKEYISDGDFDIRIRGGFSTAFGSAYPKDRIGELMGILKINDALQVTSEYLLQFGIYNVVIESYRFPQSQGFTNEQLFDISCVSDEPAELKKVNG